LTDGVVEFGNHRGRKAVAVVPHVD
jgi:hypothetical protein